MTTQAKILIIDDEREVGNFFRYLLSPNSYEVNIANTAREARALLAAEEFELAMVDLKLPDGDGISLLREIKERQPLCQVIIMTGFSTVHTAIEAIKLGAYDYIDKPFEDIEQLENLLASALNSRSGARNTTAGEEEWTKTIKQLGYFKAKNPQMLNLLSLAAKIAKKPLTILIQGETGTGKEILARFIHASSLRADQPFIPVNCGALTESLLESELFGHEKGAFTGAHTQRRGMFEIANTGTLFLDEIAEASLSTQVKLLRVLETGEYVRVGGEKSYRTDVRIVAASNVNLEQATAENRFRMDLLFRLDVVKLEIPPLRDRPEDIPLFANYFLAKAGTGMVKNSLQISPDAMTVLLNYSWPGNIRELSNVIAQAAALCEGPYIRLNHLPAKLLRLEELPANTTIPSSTQLGQLEALLNETAEKLVDNLNIEERLDFTQLMQCLKDFETKIGTQIIEKALRQTLGNRKAVTKLLNINSRTLRYLLNEKGKS